MTKKILAAVAVCCMVAGMAQGADFRYRQSGDWTQTSPLNDQPGWQLQSTVPTTSDTGIINWGNNTVTVTTTETVGSVRVGQDEQGNLVIAPTGYLTTGGGLPGDFTLGQGNGSAGTGYLTVQAGGVLDVGNILYNGLRADGTADIYGTVNVASHLWTGWSDLSGGATGTYNIYDGGVLNVSQMLGLNWQNLAANAGFININDGGTLNLNEIEAAGNSIRDNSLLTISLGGLLTKTGDFTSVIQTEYIDTGKIVGAGAAPLSVTYDEGSDLTSVVAIPEPATLGLVAIFGGALFFRRRFAR